LVVISGALRLKDVLVGGQGVSIVQVAQLLHELVHQLVIPELSIIEEVCPLLDDVVEAKTVWELGFAVDLDVGEGIAIRLVVFHDGSGLLFRVEVCFGIMAAFLDACGFDLLSHLDELEVSVEAADS